MANRYFIAGGATVNWNDVNSWSETSGGAVGATIPTSADNAIFDANSLSAPCNLTINAEANCLDLDFSGLDNLLTLTNAAFNLNVYGNLTLTSNTFLATAFTGTGYLQLRATTSVNITSNGCTRAWNRIYFDGVGGTWTNQDNWSYNTQTHLINGTWNTNDKTITTTLLWFETGVKTLTLGSSTFNCVNINYLSSGGSLTINAGTSIINTSNIPLYGSLTLYTLNITSTSLTSGITGIVSLMNLSIQSSSTVASSLSLMNNITVSNNLTLEGSNNNTFRLLLYSAALGTPRTITVNGSIIASNVDFRDITLAGTANRDLSAITGGSGDCGGNSGITFTPAENVYHYRATAGGSNWSTESLWFKGTGGIGGASRVPLPQDTAIFDANTFPVGSNSIYLNVTRIGSVDMTGVDKAFTFSLGNSFECYGSFALSPNATNSGGSTVTFRGRGSHIINTFNKIFYGGVTIETPTGIYTLHSDFQNSTNPFWVNLGTFDANDYSLNLSSLFRSKSTGTILYLGNVEHFFKIAGNDYNFYGTIFFEGSTLTFAPTGSLVGEVKFNTANKVNKVKFAGNSTTYYTLNNVTTSEIIFEAGRSIKFGGITTDKITSNGTSANKVTIQSTTEGSQATINYTGAGTPFIENVILKDINFTVPVYALNGTNLGNNTNVKYVWKVAKKTMGFPIRLVKDE